MVFYVVSFCEFDMKYAVISCSLNLGSRSRLLAKAAVDGFRSVGDEAVDYVDLAELALPICDGSSAYGDENAIELKQRLAEADGYVIASPIYNFDVNAACKNMIEMTGRDVWTDEVVGFLCAAGGKSSYMSVMGFGNSLMLDFRTVVVPRFVYATGEDFIEREQGHVMSDEISARVLQLVGEVKRFCEGLRA